MDGPDRLWKRRCSGCGNLPPLRARLVRRPGGRFCPRCLKQYEADQQPDPGLAVLPAGTPVRSARSSAAHIGGGPPMVTTLLVDWKAARRGRC